MADDVNVRDIRLLKSYLNVYSRIVSAFLLEGITPDLEYEVERIFDSFRSCLEEGLGYSKRHEENAKSKLNSAISQINDPRLDSTVKHQAQFGIQKYSQLLEKWKACVATARQYLAQCEKMKKTLTATAQDIESQSRRLVYELRVKNKDGKRFLKHYIDHLTNYSH